MIARRAANVAAMLLASAALGQAMPGMDMSGGPAHHPATAPRPAPPARATHAAPKPQAVDHRAMGHRTPAPAPAAPSTPENAPVDHDVMPGMDMPHDHATMAAEVAQDGVATPTGTDLPAGNAPAPAPPRDHYADRVWGATPMAAARAAMQHEHGGMAFSKVMLNLAEVQPRRGRNSYRWDGEAWFGGDIDRLTIKSEGDGSFGGKAERAEVQALFSRAIDPYWNLQAGIRQDIRPTPARTYATVGIEGLAPYWFQVEAVLFLSNKGDLLGRVEAYHDIRLTQRLLLQPRAELSFAAQDVAAQRIGSGLADAELGLRLRYEIRREFAPYVGLAWERKAGDTAAFARRAGEDASSLGLVLGIRAWF